MQEHEFLSRRGDGTTWPRNSQVLSFMLKIQQRTSKQCSFGNAPLVGGWFKIGRKTYAIPFGRSPVLHRGCTCLVEFPLWIGLVPKNEMAYALLDARGSSLRC